MNECLKGILIVGICLGLIIGFVFYTKAIFRDNHICKDGVQKGALTQSDTTYLECGTYGEYDWTDMIKDNKIVREKVYTVMEESHIETFETNWTDNSNYKLIWFVWVIVALSSAVTMLFWLGELLKKKYL